MPPQTLWFFLLATPSGSALSPVALTTDVSPNSTYNRLLAFLPGAHARALEAGCTFRTDDWARHIFAEAASEGLVESLRG